MAVWLGATRSQKCLNAIVLALHSGQLIAAFFQK
jgi:hypothetical protein